VNKQHCGEEAENLALEYLLTQGLRLLQRNYRQRVGEIDLIMHDCARHSVVFVEVRYRNRSDFGGPIASVDWRKQRKLKRIVAAWLQRHADASQTARIDVVAIEPRPQLSASSPTWTSPDSTSHVSATDALRRSSIYPAAKATHANNDQIVVEIYKNHQISWIMNAIEDEG